MTNNSHKSIINISMHKAGSTISDKILMEFMRAKGMDIDRIALLAPSSPLTEREVFLNYQENIKPVGVYYGVARGPYVSEMTVLGQLKIVMQVRDPRDCITSAYFSFAKSHKPPSDPARLKEFEVRREKIKNTSIDQYALSQVGSYCTRLNILRNIIEQHDDILVLKYEDMVEKTEDWLHQIALFTDQPLTPELRSALGSNIDFSVAKEDVSSHKRQVSPGDHLRKLKPETIAQMNEKMKAELAAFNYNN